MATPASEVRRGRLTRSLVLVAVVIGVAAGAMACVAGLASGRGHDHAAAGPVAAAHVGHVDADADAGADPGRPDAGAGFDHVVAGHVDAGADAGAASRDDAGARRVTEASDHPGMSCVVEVDLQVVDEPYATVCDPVDIAPVVARTQGSDGPEPPVPRSS